jgi:Nuclease-related domain
MLIKPADDKTPDLRALEVLSQRPDATAEQRKRIEQEIRNVQSGVRGEQEAAYEVEFHYGHSKNWMSIHDLRLECDGRVAQIDHLLINRFLEFYVCESKRFAEGVAINEQGEFTAFFNGRAYGIPSPLEQNRRHIAVLESVFKTGQVPLPKRLGLTIKPTMIGLVLVSKTARISRPKASIAGIDAVLKNDQLKARIDKNIEADNNVLGAVKLIGSDTLEELARALANEHRPIRIDWAAKFGLPPIAPASRPPPRPTTFAQIGTGPPPVPQLTCPQL